MKLARIHAGLIVGALACAHCGPQHAAPPPGAPASGTPAAAEPKLSHDSTPAEAAPAEATSVAPPAAAVKRPELPRGGREIFPAHRIVGFCGTPGAPALGRLMGNLPVQSKKLQSFADKYARERAALPVFELIAVIVMGAPGADGKWRRRVPDSVVDEYLAAARAAKGLLLLNIQPGHSDFITEVKHFEKYLKQPDVGVALDPEWQMHGKQKPGVFFGQTTGAAVNEVADYLVGLIKEGDLPEKALVFHQVNGTVVKDESTIVPHPGIALIKGVDGLGPGATKVRTYNYLVKGMPPTTHAGFKLFFDEDTTNGNKLMTPDEVMKLDPVPEYVMYE